MRETANQGMSLYGPSGGRKYLNQVEGRRFAQAASTADQDVRIFCLTIYFSGARISEVLSLTADCVDLDSCVLAIRTLKRRRPGVVRQVPMPRSLIAALDRAFSIRRRQRDPIEANLRLWQWSRTTAWRHIKNIMGVARLTGTAAMPKGLRHGFGVRATSNLVPQHLIQRWLGHASPRSTAIYCDVCGPEERAFAERMWRSSSLIGKRT